VRLLVPAGVRERLGELAAAAAPALACGLLLGRERAGGLRVTRALPCPNAALAGDRQHRFEIDPGVLVNVSRSLRGTPERIVGFFHSRRDGDAEWEGSDRMALARWPEMVWMAVVAAGQPQPVLRARWRNGQGPQLLEEMEIEIVESHPVRSLCPE
jgi:proteasome lid subunit RPN8/RPN11